MSGNQFGFICTVSRVSAIAHAQAYDVCGYIHRDVSAGNILLLPIIRRAGKTGSVYWQGILTDWELAKHKNVDFAREPDRTVRQLVAPELLIAVSQRLGFRVLGTSCP